MYISRLILSNMDKLRTGIKDEYTLHQFVYSLFREQNERSFLYYVDYKSIGNTLVLIQSEERPINNRIGRLDTKIIPEKFYDFHEYYFKIRISPVRRNQGKVVSVIRDKEELVRWFCSIALNNGFSVDDTTLEKVGEGQMRMRKHNNVITIAYTDLTGVLMVEDKEQFMKVVKKGLGRAKGFGLGMVMLKPIKEAINE